MSDFRALAATLLVLAASTVHAAPAPLPKAPRGGPTVEQLEGELHALVLGGRYTLQRVARDEWEMTFEFTILFDNGVATKESVAERVKAETRRGALLAFLIKWRRPPAPLKVIRLE